MKSLLVTRPCRIIRKSIHAFLQKYHQYTISIAFLSFPASAALLVSQSLIPSSPIHRLIDVRLRLIFESAGFPPLFSLLITKISQTLSLSIFIFPFTLSFLLFAKVSIILLFSGRPASLFLRLYNYLFLTQLFNYIIILAANSAALTIMFLAFNSFDAIGLSSTSFTLFLSAIGAVLYSIVFANVVVTCNLAVIVAGMENCGGCLAVLKACMLMRGRAATALSLALPTNIIFVAIEALFQYRVIKVYRSNEKFSSFSCFWEPPLIVYLYSIMTVLDTIMSCVLYRSCKLVTDLNFRTCSGMENRKEKSAKNLQEIP